MPICRYCKQNDATEIDRHCQWCGQQAKGIYCAFCSGDKSVTTGLGRCGKCAKKGFDPAMTARREEEEQRQWFRNQREQQLRLEREDANWKERLDQINSSFVSSGEIDTMLHRAKQIANKQKIVEILRLSARNVSGPRYHKLFGSADTHPEKSSPPNEKMAQVYVIHLSDDSWYVGGSNHGAVRRSWEQVVDEGKKFKHGNEYSQYLRSVCIPATRLIHDLNQALDCFHFAERVLQGILRKAGFSIQLGTGTGSDNWDRNCGKCNSFAKKHQQDWYLKSMTFSPSD